ncbi:MAG: AsmA family protein [Woeseiaceae bacterium]|nr:AsmA family protein [Woeseiaceae bacterium]
MGRILKYVLYAFGALVLLLIIGAVTMMFLFDPNDYRDTISETVYDATGRELVIEGDLDVSIFPWLAIDIGRTRLGNAEGFGDEPFLEFETARLSVRLLPLIFGGDISVGTAELDALSVNLEVRGDGRSNWQDLAEAGGEDVAVDEAPADAGAQSEGGTIDIAGLSLSNASIRYANAQLGDTVAIDALSLSTGRVTAGEPIDFDGGFNFSAEPAGVSGDVAIESRIHFLPEEATIRLEGLEIAGNAVGVAEAPVTLAFEAPTITLQTESRQADIGAISLSVMNVDIEADVEPFSYADSPTPNAVIRIDAFSPRTLMQSLAIDAPATADPDAFGKLMLDARLAMTDSAIRLSDVELVFDDTTFRGQLVVPRSADGTFQLDLAGDSIDATRYMAPADAEAAPAASGDAVPVEIPVDLIRALNARGNLTLDEAGLGKMTFTDLALGVNAGNGRVRFHPITAAFFDGRYVGDTRIDASGSQAVMTVDERIENVSLAPLAKAMFERENVTGLINGRFQLSGRGNDMGAIQRTLSGNMSFVLSDGAFEGTDVWYELRKARARFKQEQPPEPTLPARTRFSEVSATGQVTNGVMQNNDFKALLPFMELTGRGSVNFVEATVDYSMSGRVLDKPELIDNATPEEIADLTQVVIPLKIEGPLASPSIGVDIQKIIEDRVKEEIEDEIKDRLKDLFRRD